MNSNRLLIKNTAVLTAGKVFGDLFTFFFLVYFARIFGADILGRYAFAMSFSGLLAIFISMGLNTVMVRDLSQDRSLSAKYLVNLLAIQGILAILIWLSIGFVAFTLTVSHDTKFIIILMATYHVFYKLTMIVKTEFRAHEEMQYSAFLEIFHKVSILILGMGVIMIWKNPVITLAVYPISAFSMFLLGLRIALSRYGWPTSKVEYPFIKRLLKKAVPFLIVIILSEFYVRIGIILLAYFQGEHAVGIYAAADRLLVTIATGARMFGIAILPTMSRLSNYDQEEFLKLFERAIRLIMIAVLPLCTILFISSQPIIILFFGDEYRESIVVLSILSWSILFYAINFVLRAFIIVKHRQNLWVKFAGITFLGYVVVCSIVIPWYSYLGLAYVRLFTEMFLFVIIFFHIHKYIHKIPIFKIGRAPLISCVISIMVFYSLGNIQLWIKIPCAMLICVIFMFILRGIQIHDFYFAKKILISSKEDKMERRISIE